MTSLKVTKVDAVVPITRELLTDHVDLWSAIRAYRQSTPRERAQWAAEAGERRAAERQLPRVELTLDVLLDKLGFSRQYAEHLVQPYCYCGDGMDGWETCEHARDQGITR